MDYLTSDIPGDESPHCCLCSNQIGLEREAIALRVGKVVLRGRMWTFVDHLFDDREDIRWFHFDCLSNTLPFHELMDDITPPSECAFCPEDLIGEAECYELELGEFHVRGPDTWWTPHTDKGEQPVRLCACTECIEWSVGEGDGPTTRRRLGKEPLPTDDVRWIQDVPRSMTEEPPHLRRTGRRPPTKT